MAVDRLAGVLAPVLTPMRADLAPDVEKWIAFSQQLLADGCTGLAPFGTTSEANSLGLGAVSYTHLTLPTSDLV